MCAKTMTTRLDFIPSEILSEVLLSPKRACVIRIVCLPTQYFEEKNKLKLMYD